MVTANGQLARFELQRELGRGAQARVWLAHDPRLEREVALKLLDPDAGADAVSVWLHEARAVSRLGHPNIVPVFEADEHEGQPYLVFEYVEGPTLAQARRGKPPMPAREAVALMVDVLDALAAAHEMGIVHRDLKPSNILLGRDGRARVMDFGIAARVAVPEPLRRGAPAEAGDGRIMGTPGYISPEAARGEAPVPAMDVFAAGALLGELLAGAPLLRETDPCRAVERVKREDLRLPATAKVDDTLRGIVQRALTRDIASRYDSARAMQTALRAWLNPDDAADPDAGSSHATLEFLLRRMRHKTDFPALSSSVVRIQRVAASETDSLRKLSDEILKDVSLTNKLLRMVNTAHFTSVAGEGIGTVSRAVALVGFAGIRNMALSVVLLEHMTDKAHAGVLKEEFLRALMAGALAEELTSTARKGEEAFLGAMFQNLGRLLTECYLPDEAVQIRQALGADLTSPASAVRREAVARRVLGLSLDDLGAGVAEAWGLPASLRNVLRLPRGDAPSRPAERGIERQRWLARSANAIADAMLGSDGDAQVAALHLTAETYAPALGLQARDLVSASYATRNHLKSLAQALGVHVAAGAPARRLLEATHLPGPSLTGDGSVVGPVDIATMPMPLEPSAAHAAMTKALDEVRMAVASPSMRLGDVLPKVLNTMYSALDFRRVVLCLREAGHKRLSGRIGLGQGGAEISAAFRIQPDLNAVGDLFAWLTAKGADLMVRDAATVAARLPAWYRQRVNAPTFLLLPLMLKGQPIGLIYGDKSAAGAIVLDEDELALLRALRDQAALAFAKGQA
ncbi:MAG: serine/threonine protein kinase [Leptothrix sp. (in: Bacteria)]|nr:serine/threonine protein kinase [Leptothrix sp. (in: b-proteobacteria)]